MCLILVTMGVGLFFNKLIAFLVSIIFYVFLQASVSSTMIFHLSASLKTSLQ